SQCQNRRLCGEFDRQWRVLRLNVHFHAVHTGKGRDTPVAAPVWLSTRRHFRLEPSKFCQPASQLPSQGGKEDTIPLAAYRYRHEQGQRVWVETPSHLLFHSSGLLVQR